ncbi:RhuM family protein [Terricaulis sp.]|uniref:RhuM family protein n=1 Tax=Terricaulis sp. TaxID=2768686 RepID=UPI002AC3A3AC|nr:RhuM family protein [Terricaulis sp.]MDZ4692855.1 RhuM family protein [Terricaulis sp.]
MPYVGKNGVEVSLVIQGETFWASQGQMAEMFGISRSGVTRHISRIVSDGELSEEGNVHKMYISPATGRAVKLYSLNMMISVGYRVESKQGTLFRIWATDKLVEYLTKGFVIDAPRLKEPDAFDRVQELREIIRDIRAAEANIYAELRRICALCADYDPASDEARHFYANMQAKLYWAVVSYTPSMVLMERADAEQPNMGLQNWPKENIRQEDAVVAKNYLAGAELEELNRLTTILLDIFDDQLKIGKLTLMAEATALLDAQLANLNRAVLKGGGKAKADDAKAHAKAEYKKFDERRRALRARERQAELVELKETAKSLPKPKKK